MCSIEDITVLEKGVEIASHVYGDDGSAGDLIDTYYGNMDRGYYECSVCNNFWQWTMVTRLEVWQKVKEHLDV
jgi:hypothetical protein